VDAFTTGKALVRQYERFPFVDACTVVSMQTGGPGSRYAFDDDSDGAEDGYRLDTATDPCRPR
jgi:hypothetical protein